MGKGTLARRKRVQASKLVRTRHLIVCGGETEECYFNGFKNFIYNQVNKNKDMVCIDIITLAYNPLKMVNETINAYIDEYNHIWIVFDKDDFKDFDNAIKKIDAKNKSIEKSNIKTEIHALWSNKCFELWLLLHFQDSNADFGIGEYKSKLTNHLGRHYEKNDSSIFNYIIYKKGNILFASERAKKLYNTGNNAIPSKTAPATSVFLIVDYFKKMFPDIWELYE